MKLIHVARLNMSSYLKRLGPLSPEQRYVINAISGADNQTFTSPYFQ